MVAAVSPSAGCVPLLEQLSSRVAPLSNPTMLFYYSLAAFVALLGLGKQYLPSGLLFIYTGNSVSFHYRAAIIPHVPERVMAYFPALRHYTPLSTFSEQATAGLSSSQFDIEANIRDGDSRAGLDEHGTQEVMEIMRRERVK